MVNKKVEFLFIDFEKSLILHPVPRMISDALETRKLWPTGVLGEELSKKKKLVPSAMIQRIEALTTEQCTEIIQEVVAALDVPIAWADDSADAIARRAGRTRRLVEELWANK